MSNLKEIQEILKKKSSKKVCESFKKFIPSSQNVYGVKVPVLNEIAKNYKDGGFDIVQSLWNSGAFEERLLAAKILAKASKSDPDRALKLLELFSKDISDWAVCDTLGQQGIKPIAKLKRKEIFDLSSKLVKSSNFWKRRLSLVVLESYKKDISSHKFILSIMKQLEGDKEYYVKKAVEWTKRDIAKAKNL